MNPNHQTQGMTDSEYREHVAEKLSHFGDRAGQHGPLSTITVPTMVRLSRSANLRATTLARRLGTRKSTWLAQLAEVASLCHPDDWYRAMAAFQNACKHRAPSESVNV